MMGILDKLFYKSFPSQVLSSQKTEFSLAFNLFTQHLKTILEETFTAFIIVRLHHSFLQAKYHGGEQGMFSEAG